MSPNPMYRHYDEPADLDHLPKKLGVLGSGFISMEFASIFKKLGSDVSVFFIIE